MASEADHQLSESLSGSSSPRARRSACPWILPASAGSTWIADHTRLARALGKPLVLGEFGPARIPPPAGTAQAAGASSFSVGATSVTPNLVSRGQTIAITTAVTAGAAASGITVDIEIYSPQGKLIGKQTFSGQVFAANQTLAYSWNWPIGSSRKPGSYLVKIRVSNGSRSVIYSWVDPAATFTVM